MPPKAYFSQSFAVIGSKVETLPRNNAAPLTEWKQIDSG
jgi:hypothetical protein